MNDYPHQRDLIASGYYDDFGTCPVCDCDLVEGPTDCDPDTGRQWRTAECNNPMCPESPEFNEDDPKEIR